MSGLASLLLGAAGGYANAYAAKQQNDYKDAKLKAMLKGEPMPEAPKSLGSQLVDKVKDALPTFGSNVSPIAPSSSAVPAEHQKVSSVVTEELKPETDAHTDAWNDSVVSDKPDVYQNIYGKGRV